MWIDAERPFNHLPSLPPGIDLETPALLKASAKAQVAIARLDQATDLMPNPSVLINTIPLLEAQASSEIENIVTTTDSLFQATSLNNTRTEDPAIKETLRYRQALRQGFDDMHQRALTKKSAIAICSEIKGVDMDVRNLHGTRIANPATGKVIYSPPEGRELILDKLDNWESFVNNSNPDDLDPIIRMAVAHYQFEAIHPFADGNGRTGRILNILMLVNEGLLRQPILYLSRYIIKNKNDYYHLLNGVTRHDAWTEWVHYMVKAVEDSATSTTRKILAIRDLQEDFAERYQSVSKGMTNIGFVGVLFDQPYCRIQNVMDRCQVTRPTAADYLRSLEQAGALTKIKIGRDTLYLNHEYLNVLTRSEGVG